MSTRNREARRDRKARRRWALIGSALVVILCRISLGSPEAAGPWCAAGVVAILAVMVPALIVSKPDRRALIWMTLLAVAVRVGPAAVVYESILDRQGGTHWLDRGFIFSDSANHFVDPAAGIVNEWVTSGSWLPTWNPYVDTYPLTAHFGAVVYRIFSPSIPIPFLFTTFLALVNALAVPLVFIAVRRFSQDAWTARIAALWMALQPEFIVWTLSPTRDSLLMPAIALLVVGMAQFASGVWGTGVIVSSAGALAISLVHGKQGIFWTGAILAIAGSRMLRHRRALGPAFGVIVIALLGLFVVAATTWRDLSALPPGVSRGLGLSAILQQQAERVVERTEISDTSQAVLMRLPLPVRVPVTVAWGAMMPNAANGMFWPDPVFQALLTLRGIGWHLMLPLVLVGMRAAWRSSRRGSVLHWLVGLAAVSVAISELQDLGDIWDSARYRVSVASLFCLFAALGLAAWRRRRDPRLPLLFGIVWFVDVGLFASYAVRSRSLADIAGSACALIILAVFYLRILTSRRISTPGPPRATDAPTSNPAPLPATAT